MPEFASGFDITAELAWGENKEASILKRWSELSEFGRAAKLLFKTPSYAAFDFLMLNSKGLPLAYLEVKRRRTAFLKYGDAMCPISKIQAAKALYAEYGIHALLVTEYGCGTLVEVPLVTDPALRRDVSRRDRPGMKPVPHGLYTREQLTVLAEES